MTYRAQEMGMIILCDKWRSMEFAFTVRWNDGQTLLGIPVSNQENDCGLQPSPSVLSRNAQDNRKTSG